MTDQTSDREGAGRIVDELLPESVDWEELVRTYPIPSLLVATAFGFVLGRHHGSAIVAGLVSFAGRRAGEAMEELLDDRVFE